MLKANKVHEGTARSSGPAETVLQPLECPLSSATLPPAGPFVVDNLQKSTGPRGPRLTRHAILLRLQKHVAILNELRDAIENVRLETPPSTLLRSFRMQYKRGLLAIFEGRKDELLQFRQLRRELKRQQGLTQENLKKSEERVEKLLGTGGVRFAHQLRHTLSSLLAKNAYVRHVTDRPWKLRSDLWEKAEIESRAIISKEFHPFTVRVTVDPYYLAPRRAEQTLGEHYRNTALSLAFGKDEKRNAHTFAHEEVHNLLDGLVSLRKTPPHDNYLSFLKELATDLPRSAYRSNAIKRLHEINAGEVVDECHEEILAEFYISRTRLGRLTSDTAGSGPVELSHYHPRRMSTAGLAVQDISSNFDRYAKKFSDRAASEYCAGIDRELPKIFNERLDHLREACFIAESISPALLREIEALSLILKPSQWRHCTSYLETRCGRSVVEALGDYFKSLDRGPLDPGKAFLLSRFVNADASDDEFARLDDRLEETSIILKDRRRSNEEVLAELGLSSDKGTTRFRALLSDGENAYSENAISSEVIDLIEARRTGKFRTFEGQDIFSRTWARIFAFIDRMNVRRQQDSRQD